MRTEKIRGNIQNLFIYTKSPYKEASTQTISRWIKTVLSKSGLDTSIFSAHLIRHAAASSVFAKGLDLALIRKTAGWSERS